MPSHVPISDRSPTVQVNIPHLIDDVQCRSISRSESVHQVILLFV
jgi:hypothetical protein